MRWILLLVLVLVLVGCGGSDQCRDTRVIYSDGGLPLRYETECPECGRVARATYFYPLTCGDEQNFCRVACSMNAGN